MDISPNTTYYSLLKPLYVAIRYRMPSRYFFKLFWDPLKTRVNLARNRHKDVRHLEIGADIHAPIDGFERLTIEGSVNIDYVADASKRLPFGDDSFDLVYASHVLEHIPWYQSVPTLREWRRILKPGGVLEVWVPDALKICENLVRVESGGGDLSHKDGYYKLVQDKDPRQWAALRLFTFGDGKGTLDHPNWHRAMFTPSLLRDTFVWAGFREVRIMEPGEVRGRDHGWINLGVSGKK